MRYSVNIPNFGDFADPRTVARLARAAEGAGWDGLFVWDHVLHDRESRRGVSFGDPWMLLTAAALATTRLRLGTLLTPVPRRRPHQLARQVATLDALSGGRVVLGAGLGGPIEDEYGSFGEPTDPRVLAGMLDEGLELLGRYWSGERVTHRGTHWTVDDAQLLPASVQRPRPPVWIGGFWPSRPPMRRAARWDGAVPLFREASHGTPPDLAQVRELMAYVREHRAAFAREHPEAYVREHATPATPFDLVLGGISPRDPDRAAELIAPYAEAGMTWWDERQAGDGEHIDRLAPVLRRVEAGPPAY
ncbi:LLM class flavin-dependent oxidoreductase [Streptomyces sp. NPDC088674]|uniref:LLM class flavin-dependent oxidoreductase n=1 Tax=Streptomyces sp. NPDC088674 TaxID=3365869 RepID=UPI003821AD92